MKKLILIVVLASSLFLSVNLFAAGWAIGGDFVLEWGNSAYPNGAALCFKIPNVPVMFGLSANLDKPLVIGITADWWAYQAHLVGPVNIYIGPGAFLKFSTESSPNNNSLRFGLRIPFGFQIFIVPAFEIFLEPAVAIELVPKLPDFSLQAALGFRFWF